MRSGYLISGFRELLVRGRELLPQQWRKVEVRFSRSFNASLYPLTMTSSRLVSAAGFRLLSTNADDELENMAIEKIVAAFNLRNRQITRSEDQIVLKVGFIIKAIPWMPQNGGSPAIDAAHQSSIQADIYVSIPKVEGFSESTLSEAGIEERSFQVARCQSSVKAAFSLCLQTIR